MPIIITPYILKAASLLLIDGGATALSEVAIFYRVLYPSV